MNDTIETKTHDSVSEKSLDELLEEVEQVERDFRLGKIEEKDVEEYMIKVAKFLSIPTESP
tara:strand:+ start:451 stop:633 length:183 start_codon:yes stop_codon:yes gene_type:complete